MDDTQLAALARQLQSTLPIVGVRLRRFACRRLGQDGGRDVVPLLIKALDATDATVAATAEAALRSLADQAAIDVLCAAWARGRDQRLARIIAQAGHVAQEPVLLNVLTGVLTGALGGEQVDARHVPGLLEALGDSDRAIESGAERLLRALRRQPAIDALCRAWAEGRDRRLGAIVAECRYVASGPLRVRLLTELNAGVVKAGSLGAEETAVVVEALDDVEGPIRERAGAALRALRRQDAVDALCEAAIADPSGAAGGIAA